jgi:hypothetical protein
MRRIVNRSASFLFAARRFQENIMTTYYKTDDEIRTLVESFEACSFHPSEFRHYQHLTVALWYVWHLPFDVAETRMKAGIRRLAQTYGKMGYHETITVFWLRMVANFAAREGRGPSLAETANRLISEYDIKKLIFDYYSAEVIESARAKAEWVEPDLKNLPVQAEQRSM